MKLLGLLCMGLLLLAPFVIATHATETPKESPRKERTFRGLQGIVGVSVEESEKPYGPLKPFGKPVLKRAAPLRLPLGYKGLGGISGKEPGISKAPCEEFNCKKSQYVVGDIKSKAYYRCYCPAAKNIPKENLKCIDTPGLAEKIGYHSGVC